MADPQEFSVAPLKDPQDSSPLGEQAQRAVKEALHRVADLSDPTSMAAMLSRDGATAQVLQKLGLPPITLDTGTGYSVTLKQGDHTMSIHLHDVMKNATGDSGPATGDNVYKSSTVSPNGVIETYGDDGSYQRTSDTNGVKRIKGWDTKEDFSIVKDSDGLTITRLRDTDGKGCTQVDYPPDSQGTKYTVQYDEHGKWLNTIAIDSSGKRRESLSMAHHLSPNLPAEVENKYGTRRNDELSHLQMPSKAEKEAIFKEQADRIANNIHQHGLGNLAEKDSLKHGFVFANRNGQATNYQNEINARLEQLGDHRRIKYDPTAGTDADYPASKSQIALYTNNAYTDSIKWDNH